MTSSNYFDCALSARRYAAARPDVHSAAFSRFVGFAKVQVPVQTGMDVGCGTGQSTRCLAQLARHVVGLDPSEAMLGCCRPGPGLDWVRGRAEEIPVRNETMELMVAAQAFHWFTQELFLDEARRVLTPGGWLLIYNAGFTSEMKDNPDFGKWFRNVYLVRYPTPTRNPVSMSPHRASGHGFSLRGVEEFGSAVPMTRRMFSDYQLSTTNVIAAVGDRPEAFDQAESWIDHELVSLFGGPGTRIFMFAGTSWYLQKQPG